MKEFETELTENAIQLTQDDLLTKDDNSIQKESIGAFLPKPKKKLMKRKKEVVSCEM